MSTPGGPAMERPIYLDYHASTPCDPRVVEAMLPYFTEKCANPSSITHRAGYEVSLTVTEARAKVADLIGARQSEIVFTSGATEANNLAILGLLSKQRDQRRKVVTTPIEHKSVLGPLAHAGQKGFDVVYLPVDTTGAVSIEAAEEIIDNETVLVSIQAANNEIGTIQPVAEIAAIAHERGALVHCDAAQAVGKIPVDVEAWDVDFLSLSGHKLYGPKGVGALYVRGGRRTSPLVPQMFGGGQEDGLRPGTLNVPGIVGLGEACQIAKELMHDEAVRIAQLRDYFEEKLIRELPWIRRNGNLARRLSGNSSLTFPGIDAEALMAHTSFIAWSTGSACSSGALEPSHVLLAIGLDRTEAYQTLRVGIGRFTTQEEIDIAANAIVQAVHRIRKLTTAELP